MISPVVTLKEKESVQSLVETLTSNKHNGFPVIRESEHGQPASFIGLVLRSQLVVILRRRAFLADPSRLLNLRDFSTTVSSRSETVPADFTAQELAAEINLVPFMNPAPFSVQEQCPTSRVYRLYGRRQAPPLARRPPSLARALRGQVPGDGAAASASDKRQLVVPMRARLERCVSACLQGGGGRRERRARNRHPQGPPLRLLARPVLRRLEAQNAKCIARQRADCIAGSGGAATISNRALRGRGSIGMPARRRCTSSRLRAFRARRCSQDVRAAAAARPTPRCGIRRRPSCAATGGRGDR